MTGFRMSLLPLTQLCGAAGKLSQEHGAGRAAFVSTAFHAKCAGSPDANRLLSLLTDEEREELSEWKAPSDIIYSEGVVLDYESADKELEVCLDAFGFSCEPEEALTVGHLDFAWVRQVGELRVAFVEDIKRQRYTTPDGPESLQLQSYGRSYALANDCDAYVCGLWLATEGEHVWSEEMTLLDSDRARLTWERIYAAANNDSSQFTTGPHCKSCYARLHCPEYAQPFIEASTGLATLADIGLLDGATAGQQVIKVQAIIDVAERWLENAKEAVRHGKAEVTNGNGKRWALVQEKQPRESFNKERFLREVPNAASFYERKGEPRSSFRWIRSQTKERA